MARSRLDWLATIADSFQPTSAPPRSPIGPSTAPAAANATPPPAAPPARSPVFDTWRLRDCARRNALSWSEREEHPAGRQVQLGEVRGEVGHHRLELVAEVVTEPVGDRPEPVAERARRELAADLDLALEAGRELLELGEVAVPLDAALGLLEGAHHEPADPHLERAEVGQGPRHGERRTRARARGCWRRPGCGAGTGAPGPPGAAGAPAPRPWPCRRPSPHGRPPRAAPATRRRPTGTARARAGAGRRRCASTRRCRRCAAPPTPRTRTPGRRGPRRWLPARRDASTMRRPM